MNTNNNNNKKKTIKNKPLNFQNIIYKIKKQITKNPT